jgi:ferredoxin
MPLKIVVDWDLCEGQAMCQRAAPEVFKVDENDMMHVLDETPPESLREKVETAVRRCPRRALKLEQV